MRVEQVGQQIRIRVRDPHGTDTYSTLDVGKKGRLQIVRGYWNGKWITQSIRMNMKDYNNVEEPLFTLKILYQRNEITKVQCEEAQKLVMRWFGSRR